MELLDICCNPLQLALLERNLERVNACIENSRDSLHERNKLGQTALHIAADWPWAVEKLIKSGSDVAATDNHLENPLFHACRAGAEESVRMLLSAGSPILLVSQQFSGMIWGNGHQINVNVQSFLEAFVRRREELLDCARLWLPRSIFQDFTRKLDQNNRLPDTEVFHLISALMYYGQDIDQNYWGYDLRSIYELQDISIQSAEFLYCAGFQNVDDSDRPATRPILNCWNMSSRDKDCEKLLWLIAKGADLDKLVTVSGIGLQTSTVNYIAAFFGEHIVNDWYDHVHHRADDPMRSNAVKRLLRLILGQVRHGSSDDCRCLCTNGGCTPASTLFKVIRGNFWWTIHDFRNAHVSSYIQHILVHCAEDTKEDPITSAAIRMSVHNMSGVRHTCCQVNGWEFSAEEAAEFIEEDRFRRARFERLLPKAQKQWQETSLNFHEFWTSFQARYERRTTHPNQQNAEKRRLREIGCQIEENDHDEDSDDIGDGWESDFTFDDSSSESDVYFSSAEQDDD